MTHITLRQDKYNDSFGYAFVVSQKEAATFGNFTDIQVGAIKSPFSDAISFMELLRYCEKCGIKTFKLNWTAVGDNPITTVDVPLSPIATYEKEIAKMLVGVSITYETRDNDLSDFLKSAALEQAQRLSFAKPVKFAEAKVGECFYPATNNSIWVKKFILCAKFLSSNTALMRNHKGEMLLFKKTDFESLLI